jgi:hypothetical protein
MSKEYTASIFRVKEKLKQQISKHSLPPASNRYLLGFLFDPEDGNDIFLRNVIGIEGVIFLQGNTTPGS